MIQYIVYFTKHVTGYTMRYGIYETHDQAIEALTKAKAINTIDQWTIETRYVVEPNNQCEVTC